MKKINFEVEGYAVEQKVPTFEDAEMSKKPSIELPIYWAGKNVICIVTEEILN